VQGGPLTVPQATRFSPPAGGSLNALHRDSRAVAVGARLPVVVGGGTPFLPPVTEDVPLDLIETRTFGSRVIYERYGRVRDESG
jgi:hypothetical protein